MYKRKQTLVQKLCPKTIDKSTRATNNLVFQSLIHFQMINNVPNKTFYGFNTAERLCTRIIRLVELYFNTLRKVSQLCRLGLPLFIQTITVLFVALIIVFPFCYETSCNYCVTWSAMIVVCVVRKSLFWYLVQKITLKN